MSLIKLSLLLGSALFNYTALFLMFLSVVIGNAGVVLSLFNSNAAIHAAISYLLLHQQMSKGQAWGIAVQFVGICVMTMGDIIFNKFSMSSNLNP